MPSGNQTWLAGTSAIYFSDCPFAKSSIESSKIPQPPLITRGWVILQLEQTLAERVHVRCRGCLLLVNACWIIEMVLECEGHPGVRQFHDGAACLI